MRLGRSDLNVSNSGISEFEIEDSENEEAEEEMKL